MSMFLETGTFGDSLIDSCDAKLAIWTSLLPACKKDPLRKNGSLDEVMYGIYTLEEPIEQVLTLSDCLRFTAHMIAAM